MRPIFCADWRVLMLAVVSTGVLSFMPLQAQQAPQGQGQAQPGTEATPAVGSQVAPMKPGCAPTTATGDKQQQHAPTQAMNQNVPAMNPQDCPTEDANTGTKQPPK